MSVVDFLISKLAPNDCLGCGREGRLACETCVQIHFTSIPDRCYRCRRISAGSRTCPSCRKTSKLHSVKAAVVYDGLAKGLVWQLKFHGAQTAATEMAGNMPRLPGGIVIPVPTATRRVRRRGYDQAKLLARQVARQNRLPYVGGLKRSGQSHQVGASRTQRFRQLATAFRVSAPLNVKGQDIILVDDVVTTGATLEAAATVVKRAGARTVRAVVFAQA